MLMVALTVWSAGDAQRLLLNERAQLLGQAHGVLGERLRQDEHELLAAVATEGVADADGLGDEARDLAQHRVAGGVAVRVVDRLEAVDVDEGDAERLVVTSRPVDLGPEHGEQGLAVRDAGEPVVRGAGLDLEEGAAGGVERASQAPLAGNAALAQVNRLVGLERSLQRGRDAVETEPDVAPRQQRHGRHAGSDGDGDDERQHLPLLGIDLRCDRDGHEQEQSDRHGGQEAQGTNDDEHPPQHGRRRPGRPWVDGHAPWAGIGRNRPRNCPSADRCSTPGVLAAGPS